MVSKSYTCCTSDCMMNIPRVVFTHCIELNKTKFNLRLILEQTFTQNHNYECSSLLPSSLPIFFMVTSSPPDQIILSLLYTCLSRQLPLPLLFFAIIFLLSFNQIMSVNSLSSGGLVCFLKIPVKQTFWVLVHSMNWTATFVVH